MVKRRHRGRRRGATVVEMAIIGPLLFLLLFGIAMGGLGVFRYSQVAYLAQEGSRWAAVQSRDATGRARFVTSSEVTSAIMVHASGMDRGKIRCTATWDADRSQVTVKVEYDFVPECYWRPMTLSRTAIYFIPR